MYVYVLLITYVLNDVMSVKNQRKCKKNNVKLERER